MAASRADKAAAKGGERLPPPLSESPGNRSMIEDMKPPLRVILATVCTGLCLWSLASAFATLMSDQTVLAGIAALSGFLLGVAAIMLFCNKSFTFALLFVVLALLLWESLQTVQGQLG